MVGFKGRIGFKQYLPMKPTKRGYKIWVRADAVNGYMCDFRVYTGKDSGRPTSGLDLGGEVVRQLSEDLSGKNYFLFFDNFFSSIALLQHLQKVNLYCCCTTRPNRRLFPSELKNLSLEMGEYRSKMVNTVEAVVWKDKKNVAFLNNIYGQSETQVNRKQCNGSVTSPVCAAGYNTYMGGVDLADQKRKAYTCSRKSEKWWFRLFWFLLDIAIVKAHIISTLTPGSKKR